MSRIVIAPDSFKGTATAADAARAIARGWHAIRPHDEVVLRPMADGGEGTLDAFAVAVPDAVRMPVTVRGPDSAPVTTEWLLLPGPRRSAVVELASTSGITLLDPPAPFDAHTFGFGEAIGAALDRRVDRLLLALGGSASTDGGVGALSALGGRFLDSERRPIALGNRGLGALAHIDLSALRALPCGGAVALSDVTNPLLGPSGAASVFGHQKGATPDDVVVLEANLARLSRLTTMADPAMPGAGAAGGAAFGLLAWGARLTPGSAAVGDALGVPDAIATASALITGEGRFDGQSLDGKVPSYLLGVAADAGIPVMLAAGAIDGDSSAFADAASLTELAGSVAAAKDRPLDWLEAAGARLAIEYRGS